MSLESRGTGGRAEAEVAPHRGGLAAIQQTRLRRLLEVLRPANRFYEAKLAAAGAPAQVAGLEEFTARFPFTTKQELVDDQASHPPLGTNLTFPIERYTRFHQTSGTTGHPLRWVDTPESWDHMTGCWMEVLRAAGVRAGDRVLFAFTFGPFIGFWMAFEAAERLGCLCLPGGGLSSTARLRLILDNAVTVVCCTPTYAARLAAVAIEEHLDLARSAVRTLVVAGEPGGSVPAVRDRLSRLWHGARVFDHHGMTEVGPVTYECPVTPGRLHVLETSYLAEVIDPATGRAADSGQTGELVLTTLGRVGSPLLRYRTGDLVRPASAPSGTAVAPCACGRSELALEGGILGRADDMVIVRGVNVFPAGLDEVIQRSGGVAEYQVEVFTTDTRSELAIRIEAVAGPEEPGAVARRIQRALQDAFALRLPVTAVPHGSLPRFEMKARRWTRRQGEVGAAAD